MAENPTAGLHVIGGSEEKVGLWGTVISDVAALVELPPMIEVQRQHDAGPVPHQEVLSFAAATTGPVLVLPPSAPPATAAAPSGPRTRRVLVPLERSRAERDTRRKWVERAQELGFEVSHLHVLTEATRPSMWEGPGHPAEAWWSEVRHRNHVGDAELSISSGDPVDRILVEESRCDFIILFWREDPSLDHAANLRRIISSTGRPLLLIRRSAPGTETPRQGNPGRPLARIPGPLSHSRCLFDGCPGRVVNDEGAKRARSMETPQHQVSQKW